MLMLEIKAAKKSYLEPDGRQLPVLDIPHFRVDSGEQVVLRGRSGCGKTTLLHAIAGIGRLDAGTIVVNGVDITRLAESPRDRFRARNIGYVFQTFNLLPGFSALENVLLGMTFTGQRSDRGRAAQLLDRVGLSHRATHRPAALSVGEQQRVAVARALANSPKLLLADEPTANIDPANQQQVIDLIRHTCLEEGVALILVTHAGEVAEQFERVESFEQFNRVSATAI
jgi:putative ABC transport system ATP-binding protein